MSSRLAARRSIPTAAQLTLAGPPRCDNSASFRSKGTTATCAPISKSIKIKQLLRFTVTGFESKLRSGTLAIPFLNETRAEGTTQVLEGLAEKPNLTMPVPVKSNGIDPSSIRSDSPGTSTAFLMLNRTASFRRFGGNSLANSSKNSSDDTASSSSTGTVVRGKKFSTFSFKSFRKTGTI